MVRHTTYLFAACMALACVSTVMAQGGGGRGGRPGGGGGRGMDAAMAGQQAAGNQVHQPNMTNMAMAQAMQNQNQNQNMPTIAQLATNMMSTYDADSNGSLNITELQAALTALRDLMVATQQNGNAANNAGANGINPQGMAPPRRR